MKINAFSKTYEGRKVLDMPEMELISGKIYAVIGANGSGKSTLAKCLAGILTTDQKEQILSPDISVGYMPQKSYAFRMSVEKNILLGSADLIRAKKLMKDLQLEQLAKKSAAKLSGGETARMALGRVLMKSFDLLILDEPTAAMDMETTSLAENLLMEYCRETGCVLLLVTHSLQQARRVADEVLFYYKGKLVETGKKETVLYCPEQEQTKKFLEFYGE